MSRSCSAPIGELLADRQLPATAAGSMTSSRGRRSWGPIRVAGVKGTGSSGCRTDPSLCSLQLASRWSRSIGRPGQSVGVAAGRVPSMLRRAAGAVLAR